MAQDPNRADRTRAFKSAPKQASHIIYDLTNVNFDNFELLDINPIGDDAYNRNIKYNKQPFKIETPNIKCMFGISTYTPHQGGRKSHSINLRLDPLATVDFCNLMDDIDKCVRKTQEGTTYWSFIKEPKSGVGFKHMRVKIRTKQDGTMLLKFIDKDGKIYPNPQFEDIEGKLSHGDTIKATIRLCSIWRRGDQEYSYGCSWDVSKIVVISENDKPSQPQASVVNNLSA